MQQAIWLEAFQGEGIATEELHIANLQEHMRVVCSLILSARVFKFGGAWI